MAYAMLQPVQYLLLAADIWTSYRIHELLGLRLSPITPSETAYYSFFYLGVPSGITPMACICFIVIPHLPQVGHVPMRLKPVILDLPSVYGPG